MKNRSLYRSLLASVSVLAFFVAVLTPPAWAAGETGVGRQYAIRHVETPCAYYLLGPEDQEKAIRITEDRGPGALGLSLAEIKSHPEKLLEMLNLSDLSHVVIASVGAPLNKSAMREEAGRMQETLDGHGLSHIPVKIFPKPATFFQRVRAEFPLATDYVPPQNAKQEEDARHQGLQITGSANITTWATLAFMGPGTGGIAWLLAVPPTAANVIIDYYVGKNRSSVNNFLARAGSSRLSALFRDAQISLLFAVPFYLLPRFTDFMVEHANGDTSMMERFLAMEMGTSLGAVGSAAYSILLSSLLQALQIFTFMNPNALVDKHLINEGTALTEAQLSKRNAWRVAGFFALTAPLFAAANNPASAVALTVPVPYLNLEVPLTVPHLAMAAIATANYFAFYNHPKRLVNAPTNLYQGMGWLMSEYVAEWLVVKPMNAARAIWRAIRGA